MSNKSFKEIREILSPYSSEELAFFIGVYCGPGNTVLSEKKFGFIITKKNIEDIIFERMFATITE